MKTLLRNMLAIVVGLFVGGAVNMGLVMLGPHLVPPPPGVDVTDAQSIAAHIGEFSPRHFLFPFLAHALGTLVGAAVAFLIGFRYRWIPVWIIGLMFLAGGIMAATMIPAPIWFILLDLLVAYLPMAWLGARLAQRISGHRT
jgi:hypothetical protein